MNKNNVIITACLLLFTHYCYSQPMKKIVGTWYLKEQQASYSILVFYDDSTTKFSTIVDTTFRFRYYIKNGFLYTRDRFHQVDSFPILKLSRRKLVFKNFRESITMRELGGLKEKKSLFNIFKRDEKIKRYYKRAPKYWRKEIRRTKKMSYRKYTLQQKLHPPRRGGIYDWNF